MKPPGLSLCLAVVAALAACDSSHIADEGLGGRFTLQRDGGVDVIDVAGRGSWCARDSSLTITVVTRDDVAGVAAFVALPIEGSESLAVRAAAGPHEAALAWRSLTDSIHAAVVGDSGFMVLRGDSLLSGRAEIHGTLADSTGTRIHATFDRIPVTRECPHTP